MCHRAVCSILGVGPLSLTRLTDTQNFVAGIASKEEIATCKATLTPASERILKCHLIDIEESSDDAGLCMKLRSVDGQTLEYVPLERGSFIVNCTDNVIEGQLDIQPIVSDDGCVRTYICCLLYEHDVVAL